MGAPEEVTVRFLVLLFALAAAPLCAAENQYVKDMAGKDYFPRSRVTHFDPLPGQQL